ncbi:Calmodulin-binding receptor-like cytoplasmic kinase 2 [Geodia barretti]|nr:Calmodulin-binding receptor-like cytoplasmic kinase 2 [Geodia barretti]
MLETQVLQEPAVVRGSAVYETPISKLPEKDHGETASAKNTGKKRFYSRQISVFQSEPLGSGVYGEVCKAKCDGLPCAAKIFHPRSSDRDACSIHRLWEELSSARHPNLVQYHGPYSDPKFPLPVLLMELCGENLHTFLERSPGPLLDYAQLNLTHDIAMALVYLHSNDIIHGNLTGNNVLVVSGTRAKVTDFGFSEHSAIDLRFKPPNAHYMSPNALEKGEIAKLDDIFSFGVVVIQILTRRPPQPTSLSEKVFIPQFEQNWTVSVPETKRRQSDLKIIADTNPLKPVILQCLQKDSENCPSAEQLSERLSGLKQCTREQQEGIMSRELQLVKRECEDQKKLIQVMAGEAEKHLVQIRESEIAINTLNGRIQGYEHTIEDQQRQMQENQRALEEHYLSIIASRDREIDAKDKTLRENVHAMVRELQQTKEQVRVLQSSLAQRDEIIRNLQDTVTGQEKVIQELNQQQPTGTANQQQQREEEEIVPVVTTVWSEGMNAPEKMYRGAAVVHEDTAFFRPVNSHNVYSYNNVLGTERWFALTDNPNWNFGLAVIEGTLTSVGGSTNQLLSLIQVEGKRRQWQAVFPPMPTQRSKVACVSTETALVVAGGYTTERYLSTVEVMDIGTLQWTTVRSLPHVWSEISIVHQHGALYLAGGITDSGASSAFLTCTLSDLLSSTPSRPRQGKSAWKELSSVPVAQSTLVPYRGRLLAIGGRSISGKNASEVYLYNPHNNSWNILDHMKVGRSMCLAVTLPVDRLVIVGGYTSSGHPTDSVEILECKT